MAQKRIKDYTLTNWPATDDYIPVDGGTNGTRKIKANNVMNAEGISGVLDLRSGDTLVRSSLVRAGNVVVMSVVIQLGSNVGTADEILKFKAVPDNTQIGNIKPGYVFDVVCSYGTDAKALSYTPEQITGDNYTIDAYSFYSPYGVSQTSGRTLRFQAVWVV